MSLKWLGDCFDWCPHGNYTDGKCKDCTIERLTKELDEAVGYATRLFHTVAPQCKPLPNISGLLTQLDNYIVGQEQKLLDMKEWGNYE
jgi:hypothetical protein